MLLRNSGGGSMAGRDWPRRIRTFIPGSKVRCPAVGRGASDDAGLEANGSGGQPTSARPASTGYIERQLGSVLAPRTQLHADAIATWARRGGRRELNDPKVAIAHPDAEVWDPCRRTAQVVSTRSGSSDCTCTQNTSLREKNTLIGVSPWFTTANRRIGWTPLGPPVESCQANRDGSTASETVARWVTLSCTVRRTMTCGSRSFRRGSTRAASTWPVESLRRRTGALISTKRSR